MGRKIFLGNGNRNADVEWRAGDDSTLPTFACEHCEGTMIPVNHPWHQDQISETQIMFSGLFEGLLDCYVPN